MKTIYQVALLSLAATSFATASSAEQLNNCKLRGGSMVQLAGDACVMEGGAVTAATPVMPVVTDASLHLSTDPKLALAQRAVANLLIKPVRDMNMKKRLPEGIERTVKFDGCKLAVEEDMHVDHGNVFSTRMEFKINSTIDLRNVASDAYSVLGKVRSYGGGMESYAVSFVEKHNVANAIAISVLEQREDGTRKFTLRSSASYWDAPKADLWIADEYGYPKGDGAESAETSKVRILYFLNTAEDAAALKQALDDVRTLCKK